MLWNAEEPLAVRPMRTRGAAPAVSAVFYPFYPFPFSNKYLAKPTGFAYTR